LLISCDGVLVFSLPLPGTEAPSEDVLLSRLAKCAVWPALLMLALASACSRPESVADVSTVRNDLTAKGGLGTEPRNNSESETSLPFHDVSNLPAGTLLTVRLNNAIAADGSAASGTFEAVVDEPVVVDGVALVPRGTNAVGRVEAARRSNLERDRGFVRLTLASIDVSGHDVPVQTSSLFASANATGGDKSVAANDASAIQLEKGRRLTFQLTGEVQIPREERISSR
jgi:hypothetical protein